MKSSKPTNIFWHLIEADGKLLVHEYGEPPTSIYLTENLKGWDKMATNLDIDKSSKHFHSIAYDPTKNY